MHLINSRRSSRTMCGHDVTYRRFQYNTTDIEKVTCKACLTNIKGRKGLSGSIHKKNHRKGQGLKLISAKNMKNRKDGVGRPNKERYSAYRTGISPYMKILKEQIEDSKDGIIRIDLEDIKKLIGMRKKSKSAIYEGLKYVLFDEGVDIVVGLGQTLNGNDVLTMRKKRISDKLPSAMKRIKRNDIRYR